jgi:hypothetical protein
MWHQPVCEVVLANLGSGCQLVGIVNANQGALERQRRINRTPQAQ